MMREIHESGLRLAHLREAFEGHEAARNAWIMMMRTGCGCDLCRPGEVCFWHEGIKSEWPRKQA
jgi:hypothetical protein